MHGVLIVDKPEGMTSAAVVARVKRATGAKRVGHTGTLDPMATGVLPVCVGEGTKIAGYLLAEDKAYDGSFALGTETDTLDVTGSVVRDRSDRVAAVHREDVESAMAALTGAIDQVPPMYSALKHRGRRLHEIARAGESVERPPRSVRVDEFSLGEFAGGAGTFSVRCTKGTYVRVLVADLGDRLGCGAHLTSLRRTASGNFRIADAISLAEIEAGNWRQAVVSPLRALSEFQRVVVLPERVAEVANGRRMAWEAAVGPDSAPPTSEETIVCLSTPAEELLAIARLKDAQLRYERVFTYGLDGFDRILHSSRPVK